MLKQTPTERFSARVQNYARYRPSYPKEILDVLKRECDLSPDSPIADVASGTGIFTRLLLENGNPVFGIEPNPDMRLAGEKHLADFPKFVSVEGTAEATTLPSHCVQFVTAAQAAHWFDRELAVREFRRILRPHGYLVLIWNDRRIEATAFSRDYEQLLVKYGTDYLEVQRRGKATGGEKFFELRSCQYRVLNTRQEFDYAGLEGRLLSSSYTPQPGDSGHIPMLNELKKIFEAHQAGDVVCMEYDTRLYFERLSSVE